jgi:hypothetical protein
MSTNTPDVVSYLHRHNDSAAHNGKAPGMDAQGTGQPSGAPQRKNNQQNQENYTLVRKLFDAIGGACDIVHSGGQFYAVGKPGPWGETFFRPVGIAQEFGAQFRRRIALFARETNAGMINAVLADKVMFHLESEAADKPEAKLALRFHHVDPT